MTLGVPLPQYNLPPFVSTPFRHALKVTLTSNAQIDGRLSANIQMKHPIWKVLGWQQELEHDPKLTKVKIAQREGFSKSRMTQMFRLLQLPEEALGSLKELNNPRLIRMLSIRQLIAISRMQASKMLEAFKELVATCHGSA